MTAVELAEKLGFKLYTAQKRLLEEMRDAPVFTPPRIFNVYSYLRAIMRPTIGQSVKYFEWDGMQSKHLPFRHAVVAGHRQQNYVNLTVFQETGGTAAKPGVPYILPNSEAPAESYCCLRDEAA